MRRASLDWTWVRGVVETYGLPFWFGIQSVGGVIQSLLAPWELLFFDAQLYLAATRTWLAGGDPWGVELAGNYFAAPPPTLLALAPLAPLPAGVGVAVITVLVVVASVGTIRLLRLPWWWLLFPPLVQCILSANPHALIVPLILLRGGALAILLKAYAAVPLVILGRWRAVGIAALLALLTAPLLPWEPFIREFPAISAQLALQSKLDVPPLVLVALSPLLLWGFVVVGRDRAAWLAVPALWPSPQFYYATIGLPARSKVAGALLALPVPGAGILALLALAAVTWSQPARGAARVPWRARLGPSGR